MLLKPHARYRLSGMIHDDDPRYAVLAPGMELAANQQIAPHYVTVPGGRQVPQYAPTVVGTSVAYDPAANCEGCFMSYKFQVNNNCYNYSTNIASNSFAQPGRMHGYFLTSPPTGPDVVKGAQLDGLVNLGSSTKEDLIQHVRAQGGVGHYVALLISPGDASVGWPGDYHWVRCDSTSQFDTWSQKDGGDQVTNFDFAGNPISWPPTADWTVNQGPLLQGNPNDIVVSYTFYCFMYVPAAGVSLI
ncbi:hypothetical protein ACV229_30035 [Burkholderia sp. MR1-5-21]